MPFGRRFWGWGGWGGGYNPWRCARFPWLPRWWWAQGSIQNNVPTTPYNIPAPFTPTTSQESQMLKSEASALKQEITALNEQLKEINQRIGELEKTKDKE